MYLYKKIDPYYLHRDLLYVYIKKFQFVDDIFKNIIPVEIENIIYSLQTELKKNNFDIEHWLSQQLT